MPYAELQKRYLWLVYYQEKLWYNVHHVYTDSFSIVGPGNQVSINNILNTIKIESTEHQFLALIKDEKNGVFWSINQEGLITKLQ